GTCALESNWYLSENYMGNALCGAFSFATKNINKSPTTVSVGDPIILIGTETNSYKIPRSTGSRDSQSNTDFFFNYKVSKAMAEIYAANLISKAQPVYYGGLAIAAIRLCEELEEVLELDLNRVPSAIPETTADSIL